MGGGGGWKTTTAGPGVRIYCRSHRLPWPLAERRRRQRATGGRTLGRGESLPPKLEGSAARHRPPGSLSSDASDPTLSAAVAVNRSPPSKRKRAPKDESAININIKDRRERRQRRWKTNSEGTAKMKLSTAKTKNGVSIRDAKQNTYNLISVMWRQIATNIS